MTDLSSLKVMCIFEACSRLDCRSELTCLAANLYHRFFRTKVRDGFDCYAVATASIKLAYRFHELPIDERSLIVAMMSIIHGPEFYINSSALKKLKQTITTYEKVISTNLEFFLNFKDDRMITPRQWEEQYRNQLAEREANKPKPVTIMFGSDDESSSDDEELYAVPLLKADTLLTRNCKYSISSHRYLLHYLKIVQLLIPAGENELLKIFEKISNVAWVILSDYHWSQSATQVYADNLACVCLMMAIETFRDQLENSKFESRRKLWRQLDRKWNLILCDDFTNLFRDRLIDSIVSSYDEHERLLRHELSLFEMDPANS